MRMCRWRWAETEFALMHCRKRQIATAGQCCMPVSLSPRLQWPNAAGSACKLIFGYLMQYFIVNKYQNGYVISDVFSAVYEVVLGTAFYIGEQCLEPAALPVFTHAMKKDGEERAWRYASSIFNLQFIILV